MTIEPVDRLEIHELAARYGNVVDDRDWDALSSVFTDDAVFIMSGFDQMERRCTGLAEIRQMMEEGHHPVAHHVTNVTVVIDADRVRLFFKVLGPGRSGRVGSADYRDLVRHEPAGWRIVEHHVSLRNRDGS
jgi:3-phenylpropionate/cinnamic acid dioxygenase small subunit